MFGQRLKELRTEFGLTQKELADKLNLTHATISKYEREELDPGKDVLIKLAKYFDVSTDFLLGEQNSRKLYATTQAKSESSYIAKEAEEAYKIDPDMLIQMCRATYLPEEERRKIREFSALIIEKHLKERDKEKGNDDK